MKISNEKPTTFPITKNNVEEIRRNIENYSLTDTEQCVKDLFETLDEQNIKMGLDIAKKQKVDFKKIFYPYWIMQEMFISIRNHNSVKKVIKSYIDYESGKADLLGYDLYCKILKLRYNRMFQYYRHREYPEILEIKANSGSFCFDTEEDFDVISQIKCGHFYLYYRLPYFSEKMLNILELPSYEFDFSEELRGSIEPRDFEKEAEICRKFGMTWIAERMFKNKTTAKRFNKLIEK